MFNSTVKATPSTQPFRLIWIIETLLFVNLREELAPSTNTGQPDGAYRYGLYWALADEKRAGRLEP